jgi:hypothetical protein
VTDNTELTQSSTSQMQHQNQFNITGTVSGGIPLISGSTTTAFTDQGRAAARSIEIPEGGWMVFGDHSFILV